VTKRKHLGFASRNFFSSFLAILEAERNGPKYFGNVFWSQTLAGVTITLKKPIKWSDVARWFDGNAKAAEIFNPHVTAAGRKQESIPVGATLLVPTSKQDIVQDDLAKMTDKIDKSAKVKKKKKAKK
jgi:membrane-bound lytic murein transglycosylase D